MRILKLFLTALMVFSLSTFVYLGNPSFAAAAMLNPTFTFTLLDVNPSTTSDMTFEVYNPADSEMIAGTIISVPPGWTIASGDSFTNGALMGEGTFTVFGTPYPFESRNSTDLQEEHTAHFVINFGSGTPIDDYIDGDPIMGYTIQLNPVPGAESLIPPTDTVFTLFGTVEGKNFLTTPAVQGDYTWTADFTGVFGATAQSIWTPTIPASSTPEGTDVTTTFSDGSSVTFAGVEVGGGTTQTTSELAPEGIDTEQFQLAGGQYYDFTLTAGTKIACPCTVILPYDPGTIDKPSVYHLEDGVWVDVTTSYDDINFTVTGTVSSFSWFAVGMPNFEIDWRLPLEWPNGQKSVFSTRIQILPIIFSLVDSNN